MKKQNEYFTDSGEKFRRLRLSNTFISLNIALTIVLLVLIAVTMTSLYREKHTDPPREEYSRTETGSGATQTERFSGISGQ